MLAASSWIVLFFVISTNQICFAFFHSATISSFLELKSSLPSFRSETSSCLTAFPLSTAKQQLGCFRKRQGDRNSLLSLKASVQDLIILAEEGNSAAIEQLVQAGTNIDGRPEDDHIQRAGYAEEASKGPTALATSCMFGKLEAARTLVRLGANVDLADSEGMTPLHLAVLGGHDEIVSLLLSSGASTALANEFGDTAADMAKECSSSKIREEFSRIRSGA